MNVHARRPLYRWCLTVFPALVLLLLSACSGGGDSPAAPTPVTKYIGLWRLFVVGDPADPGFDLKINEGGTFQLFTATTTTMRADGTYIVVDERNLTGSWRSLNTSLTGRMTFLLTSDDSADFNFIEDKPEGVKTVLYRGTRVP